MIAEQPKPRTDALGPSPIRTTCRIGSFLTEASQASAQRLTNQLSADTSDALLRRRMQWWSSHSASWDGQFLSMHGRSTARLSSSPTPRTMGSDTKYAITDFIAMLKRDEFNKVRRLKPAAVIAKLWVR